jgi:serine/threonine protein kinase
MKHKGKNTVSGGKLKFRRESFVRVNTDNVNNKYSFQTKLGEGAYGCVFYCTDRIIKQERAIKAIRKKVAKGTNNLFAELEVLRTLDHPSIIKLFFDYKGFYYVVTEYCSGSELFDFLHHTSCIT